MHATGYSLLDKKGEVVNVMDSGTKSSIFCKKINYQKSKSK